MAFYNGAMVLVDKGRATDVMYLDLCKGFDMIPHHILISDVDSGVEHTLSKFANDNKLSAAVDTIEDGDVQRNLNRLKK